MKCTPMRLLNRSEYNRSKWKHSKTFPRNTDPVFITQEYQGYSFTFVRSQTPSNDMPALSVKNLQLPDDFNTYNTGCSLERWSKKIPRLKSGTKSASARALKIFEDDYDMTVDVHGILDSLEQNENCKEMEENEEAYEDKYDIEELIRKSEQMKQGEGTEMELEKDATTKKTGDGKRKKRKLKKTIRFSFSKPASPNTEQIIRVDVTSNMSVEEIRNTVHGKIDFTADDCSRRHRKMINDRRESSKELDGDFSENGAIKFNGDAEDFVIRCSQLALSHRRR